MRAADGSSSDAGLLILPVCRHRGTIHVDRARCRSSLAKRLPNGMIYISSCVGCPVADVVPPQADLNGEPKPPKEVNYRLRDCVYRGDHIEEKEADLCGMRGQKFPVFGCNHPELSGRCVPYRICGRQAEDCCATCQKNPAVAAKLFENASESRED